jgi:hypothetical protein
LFLSRIYIGEVYGENAGKLPAAVTAITIMKSLFFFFENSAKNLKDKVIFEESVFSWKNFF